MLSSTVTPAIPPIPCSTQYDCLINNCVGYAVPADSLGSLYLLRRALLLLFSKVEDEATASMYITMACIDLAQLRPKDVSTTRELIFGVEHPLLYTPGNYRAEAITRRGRSIKTLLCFLPFVSLIPAQEGGMMP